jgi:hypothetical protein
MEFVYSVYIHDQFFFKLRQGLAMYLNAGLKLFILLPQLLKC